MKKYLPLFFSASLLAFCATSFAQTIPLTTRSIAFNNMDGRIAVFTGSDSIEGSDITGRALSEMLQSVKKQESVNKDNDSKISELAKTVSQLESKNAAQSSKIEQLQRSIDDLKRSNDSLSSLVKDLANKVK